MGSSGRSALTLLCTGAQLRLATEALEQLSPVRLDQCRGHRLARDAAAGKDDVDLVAPVDAAPRPFETVADQERVVAERLMQRD